MFNDTNIKIPMRYRFGLEGVYEENGIYWAYAILKPLAVIPLQVEHQNIF